jgi:phosphoglycolate phosphatase
MVRTFRAIPAKSIRLLVFDLDGTLIDSGADLCASVNAMLHFLGRPSLSDAVIAGYIGNGAPQLVCRALGSPSDDSLVETALAYFLDYYHKHKLDRTYVYNGVVESLEILKTAPDGTARAMAVLTNKPVGASQAICEALGLSPYFFRIYGGNSLPTKKPNPEGLNKIIHEAGVRAEETLMIGDSTVDIETARNAGAWSMGCSYGLAPQSLSDAQPDCLIDAANEWPSIFADLSEAVSR